MSGFVAGITDHAGTDLVRDLRHMSAAISHRGKDESTAVLSERCAAITRDNTGCGNRAHTHSNQAWAVVLDGLVSNLDSLRRAINLARDAGPAEIVLGGFEQFGIPWLSRIDGSFALMIVDLRSNEVLLARDRFGHRPLHFGMTNQSVWVGSDIKALLAAPNCVSAINTDSLYSSIGYGFTPGPKTLFSNLYKVVPGFAFTVSSGGSYRATDFSSPTVRKRGELSIEEAKDAIFARLRSSVTHYVRECPSIGTTLSGGIDSALIAYLATEVSDKPVPALSFGADGWPADESYIAKEAAAKLGMNFIRAFLPVDGDLLGTLRRAVFNLEEPTRFENAMALEIMARNAPGGCKGIMTGEGADYLFGSRDHIAASRIARVQQVPEFFRAMLAKLPLRESGIRQLRTLSNFLDWQSARDFIHKSMANCTDLVAGFEGPPKIETVDMLDAVTPGLPPEAQYTYANLRDVAHCWIERMEKIFAASGLECFHPFENNENLQFALELPDSVRHSGGVPKPALRSMATDLFGETIVRRDKKQLAAPMQLWLNESAQLRQAVLEMKSADCRIRDYLDGEVVDRYLDMYARDGAKTESVAVPIFRMLTFEIWLDLFH